MHTYIYVFVFVYTAVFKFVCAIALMFVTLCEKQHKGVNGQICIAN